MDHTDKPDESPSTNESPNDHRYAPVEAEALTTQILDSVEKPEGAKVFANGRRAWMQALDVILAEPCNIQALIEDLRGEIATDAVKVFKEILMPILLRRGVDIDKVLGLTAGTSLTPDLAVISMDQLTAPEGEIVDDKPKKETAK